jgi:hypothetical protein
MHEFADRAHDYLRQGAVQNQGSFRNTRGLVADTLKVKDHSQAGDYKTEVLGHGLISREQGKRQIVDFIFHLVDGRIAVNNGTGPAYIALDQGGAGLVHSYSDAGAHDQESGTQAGKHLLQLGFLADYHPTLPVM